MKKYTILLILCLAFSYVKAQTILINGSAVSVSQDVTFPYWLDSMATIEIGSQVISISALEFNIVPTTNGNSLVFVQTKIITTQETVPNGKTWKLEGVLLDSTAINNSSSGGGGQITISGSGGNMPVALSQQSSSSMNMGDAMLYCDSLQEDGYDNWVIPTIEEIMFVAGGGGEVPGTRTTDYLLSSNPTFVAIDYTNVHLHSYTIRLSGGNKNTSTSGFIRCVRHESVAVSGSNGSNSNGISLSGHPLPTMFSNENPPTGQYNDGYLYYEAFGYCDTLAENGYDDWRLPTFDEFIYLINGGVDMSGLRNGTQLWTATYFAPSHRNGAPTLHTISTAGNINQGGADYWGWSSTSTTPWKYSDQPRKCRCVR